MTALLWLIQHRTGKWFIGHGNNRTTDTRYRLVRDETDAVKFPTRAAAQAVHETLDSFRGAYQLVEVVDDGNGNDATGTA